MGSFTSVIHPVTGEELQFKTGGGDQCDLFRVGDTVPYEVFPHSPGEGYLFDDAYIDASGQQWIIIKNHKVLAVVPVIHDVEGFITDGVEEQAAFMRRKYDIKLPLSSLWSREAWAQKAISEAEGTAQMREKFSRWFGRNPVSQYVCAKMDEDGFMRRILEHSLDYVPVSPHDQQCLVE